MTFCLFSILKINNDSSIFSIQLVKNLTDQGKDLFLLGTQHDTLSSLKRCLEWLKVDD